MKGFLERMQWKMAAWMQGRYGADSLSNFLMGAAVVLILLALVLGLDILSWLALAVLVLATLRSFSKNGAARAKENETFERVTEKPRRKLSLWRKMWTNRKTTCYFKCKGCGAVLTVPRGKGTLRVVCPKCKTETMKKS